jgi:hypothetical protein
LTFTGDHSVQASQTRGAAPVLQGFWSCDADSGAITIQWTNGVVETVAFGTDKLSVSGSNNYGSRVTGKFVR